MSTCLLQAWCDGVSWWHTMALLQEQVAEAGGAPLALACLRGWLAYVRRWEHVQALGAAYERARCAMGASAVVAIGMQTPVLLPIQDQCCCAYNNWRLLMCVLRTSSSLAFL